MSKRIFSLILSLLMVLILFTACDKKDSLVGAWKNDNNGMKLVYVFDSDGTGLVASEAEALKFTWSTEGNTLKMTVGESTIDNTFEIDKDTLTITNAQETLTYTKIK